MQFKSGKTHGKYYPYHDFWRDATVLTRTLTTLVKSAKNSQIITKEIGTMKQVTKN